MNSKTVRELLADAVNGAIQCGRTTAKKMVAEKVVPNGPLGRLRNMADNVGIDYLDAIATHLGIEAWQLIHPDLDPAAIPGHKKLSGDALELALAFDAIKDKALRPTIHAIALQIVKLNPAAIAAASHNASESEGHPAPSAPASAPKKKQSRSR